MLRVGSLQNSQTMCSTELRKERKNGKGVGRKTATTKSQYVSCGPISGTKQWFYCRGGGGGDRETKKHTKFSASVFFRAAERKNERKEKGETKKKKKRGKNSTCLGGQSQVWRLADVQIALIRANFAQSHAKVSTRNNSPRLPTSHGRREMIALEASTRGSGGKFVADEHCKETIRCNHPRRVVPLEPV